ncbi:hypothetical protein ADICYQ_3491 [Cyclobacterium qasimii M12-11B]|uniref:Uncharacterized protein n=1 Tax=Cyclobacterium qasimii M12-11B TaxID=641524 RepID=S7VD18_9BACT|nr:hypothetical protein ADICYQ_3491 [Cyclobacterium qasimii M12-11B]
MERFLHKIANENMDLDVKFIGITESGASINNTKIVESFEQPAFRNKYFSVMNLVKTPKSTLILFLVSLRLRRNTMSFPLSLPDLGWRFHFHFYLKGDIQKLFLLKPGLGLKHNLTQGR